MFYSAKDLGHLGEKEYTVLEKSTGNLNKRIGSLIKKIQNDLSKV